MLTKQDFENAIRPLALQFSKAYENLTQEQWNLYFMQLGNRSVEDLQHASNALLNDNSNHPLDFPTIAQIKSRLPKLPHPDTAKARPIEGTPAQVNEPIPPEIQKQIDRLVRRKRVA